MNKFLLLCLVLSPYFCFSQDDFNTWPLTAWSSDSGIDVVQENTTVNEGNSSASITVNTASQASTDFLQTVSLADNTVADYQFCFDIYHTEGGVRARIVWNDGSINYQNYSVPTTIGAWQTICYTASSANTITAIGLRFYDVPPTFDGSEVVYVDNFVITTILPVELTYFNGKKEKTNCNLAWQTQLEQNNDYFDIQRSQDTKTWKTIDKVQGAGTTDAVQNYRFTDKTPIAGLNYYRLKQVDYDGAFEYSAIVSVDMAKEKQISIYPNPVGNEEVAFEFETKQKKGATLSIYHTNGQLVKEMILQEDTQQINVGLSDLVEGIYLVRLVHHQMELVQRFVKK